MSTSVPPVGRLKNASSGLRGLFFTGTDTGVGKTVVTAAVARCLCAQGVKVGVCKPVATGGRYEGGRRISDDALSLATAANVCDKLARVTPWVFEESAAPPVAAERQGVRLRLHDLASAVLWWRDHTEMLLVEGVGGLLCPLTERETVADLAAELSMPLVIVARTTLGTINHTLLTVEVARRRGLSVAGVVCSASEPPGGSLAEETNVGELRRRMGVPVLAVVRHRAAGVEGRFEEIEAVDWRRLAGAAKSGGLS